MCQKVQKVPKKFPQAKFHCAAFPWKLSNGKTSRDFLSLLGLLAKKLFYLGTGFLRAADGGEGLCWVWLPWQGAAPKFLLPGAGMSKEGKSVHPSCYHISQ